MSIISSLLCVLLISFLMVSGAMSSISQASTGSHSDKCATSRAHSHAAQDAATHQHGSDQGAGRGDASDDSVAHACPAIFSMAAPQAFDLVARHAALTMAADQLLLFDHPESLHRSPNT